MDLFHVGLTVASLERSIRFYVDVAGFAERAPVDHASVEFGDLTGNPGARIRTVMLRGGGLLLQLNEYRSGGGDPVVPGHAKAGSVHLAFFVDDVDAQHAALAASDGPHARPATNPITNATGTLRSFYGVDPDGVPVEFLQRLQHIDYG